MVGGELFRNVSTLDNWALYAARVRVGFLLMASGWLNGSPYHPPAPKAASK